MQDDIEQFLFLRDYLLEYPDYATAKKEFKWPSIKKFNWAIDYFDLIAKNNQAYALIFAEEHGFEQKVTFYQMSRRSNQVANFLVEIGMKKGDRAMLMMDNSVELYEIVLGIMKVGGAIIPAATMLPPDDITDRINRGNIKFLFINNQYLSRAMKAREAINLLTRIINVEDVYKGESKEIISAMPNAINYNDVNKFKDTYTPSQETLISDELFLFFTSGTTAKPKLVIHTHQYPIGHLTTMYWIGCKKGDIHYNISAPGWAKHAWSSLYAPWNAQSTIFSYQYKQFNAPKVLSMIERYKITTLCAPLSVWKLFLIEDLSKYKFVLRETVSAGEPLNPEIIKRVKEKLGLTLREGYGQTESTAMIANFKGEEIKEGSFGKVAPGYNLKLVDEFLHEVKPGEDGQLAVSISPVKPLGLMYGLDDQQKNKEIFRNDYYLTGDVAFVDETGYFYFIGRIDDVFKSLDYRISPFEIESELIVHPAILEVSIVPTVDERDRIVPKAFIVLKPNFTPSKELAYDIFNFIREHMAPYKRPRVIEFMKAFPKTISAKIIRKDLKAYDRNLREKGIKGEFEYKESEVLSSK